MRLALLGVRGSTPAPGPEFVRYGGHTSCVAVCADGTEEPQLILDAGTGLTTLPVLLGARPFRGRILLSHLHWDHVQGLPFCRSVDRVDARVDLYLPLDSADTNPMELLARGFSPPNFPIGPEGLLGDWRFLPLLPGDLDATIAVAPVAHKGGTALGIRVTLDGATLAYLPDHALHPDLPPAERVAAEQLVDGADLLLHDGQFVSAQRQVAREYGHATIEEVLAFADRCRVGSVVLTHHSPNRTDDDLDALSARFTHTPEGRAVTFARQGSWVQVAPAG